MLNTDTHRRNVEYVEYQSTRLLNKVYLRALSTAKSEDEKNEVIDMMARAILICRKAIDAIMVFNNEDFALLTTSARDDIWTDFIESIDVDDDDENEIEGEIYVLPYNFHGFETDDIVNHLTDFGIRHSQKLYMGILFLVDGNLQSEILKLTMQLIGFDVVNHQYDDSYKNEPNELT